MSSNPYSTCTTFMRTEIIRNWIEISSTIDKRRWMMGDYPMWVFCTTKGNGYILPDITSCYRILMNSASHGNLSYKMKLIDGGIHLSLQLIKMLGIPYSSERILKRWAFLQIHDALMLREFVPKRRLKFFWRFYWKGYVHPNPIRFVFLFVLARIFRVVPVEKE